MTQRCSAGDESANQKVMVGHERCFPLEHIGRLTSVWPGNVMLKDTTSDVNYASIDSGMPSAF